MIILICKPKWAIEWIHGVQWEHLRRFCSLWRATNSVDVKGSCLLIYECAYTSLRSNGKPGNCSVLTILDDRYPLINVQWLLCESLNTIGAVLFTKTHIFSSASLTTKKVARFSAFADITFSCSQELHGVVKNAFKVRVFYSFYINGTQLRMAYCSSGTVQ